MTEKKAKLAAKKPAVKKAAPAKKRGDSQQVGLVGRGVGRQVST